MGCTLRLDRWAGHFTVLLIAAREFLGAQQCCNAGATWQGVIGPVGINSEFRQQSIWPPTGMRAAQVQDGIAHARCHRTQRSGDGTTHVRAEAGASVVLPTATPF